EDLEVHPRVSSNVRDEPDEKHRDLDAALNQGSRDDESVAAVVAPAAQDGDAALQQLAVNRLDRGDDLPARVFHQHERRNANLFNRATIGLAHLRGIQNTHESQRSTAEDAKDTEASYYST